MGPTNLVRESTPDPRPKRLRTTSDAEDAPKNLLQSLKEVGTGSPTTSPSRKRAKVVKALKTECQEELASPPSEILPKPESVPSPRKTKRIPTSMEPPHPAPLRWRETYERTGTWQYTSAALLLYLGEPPRVPDEIESLFYLVLCNGVRYLLNSVADVNWFLKEFFDSFTVVGHKYRCGSKKQDAMATGALRFHGTAIRFFGSPDDPDHPLNSFITKMLEHFKARYEILEHGHTLTLWRRSSKKHKIPAPPAKMYETAQKLDTHEYFMSLLSNMLKLEDWPTEDFVGDQAASSKVAASGQSDEIPEDTTTGNDGAPDGAHAGEHDGGGPHDEEESRPSKRTKEESSSEEDELDLESPSPSPLANRFPRTDRGGPSRGVGLRGRTSRVRP